MALHICDVILSGRLYTAHALAEVVVVEATSVEIIILVGEALEEAVVVEVLIACPCLLSQCDDTGEYHVLEALGGNDLLCPDV